MDTNNQIYQPQETIFFQDETGLTVTSTRITFGTKIFYLSNLTSVKVSEIPGKKLYPSILMTVGILIFFAVLPQFRATINLNSLVGMGLSAICLIGALLWFRSEKPYYSLKLGNYSGESDLVISKDVNYLRTIAEAINQAVPKRISL